MSIQDEISKRLFTPPVEKPKETATIKRKLPNKDEQIVDAISKVVDNYQKKKKKKPVGGISRYYDYDWKNKKDE